MKTVLRRRCVFLLRRCNGFSIVEVAISIVVLGAALVPCCELLFLAKGAADADESRAVALNELEREVEMLRQRDFDLFESKPRAPLPGDSGSDYESQVIVMQMSQHLKKVIVIVYREGSRGAEVQESAEFYITDCDFPVRKIW